MKMAYVNSTQNAIQHGFIGNVAAFFARLDETLSRRRLYRETVRELNQLSGRELQDLGISRSQIRSAAYDAAYSK